MQVRRRQQRGAGAAKGKRRQGVELPEALRDLCYRNGFEAGVESFRTQVKTIITVICNGIELQLEMSAASKPPVRQTVVIQDVPTEILEAIHSVVPLEAATRAGEEIDVFISFAHGDNAPVSADQEGWVTSVHRVLQRMLSQRPPGFRKDVTPLIRTPGGLRT